MEIERTLIIIKPDGVERGLVGEVIRRFEARGLEILALKMVRADRELVQKHYQEHADKPFFGDLVNYLCSGPVVIMVLRGPKAVSVCRAMVGATDATQAAPGTIRGDFALSIERNLIHASADSESAEREIGLWFASAEVGAGV
ncbi:MAG: nucleoside-diphosphate kinase [Fimbriimonadales bacterium]|nr:nucleoside-diphosphate kinase [Fimbriimonadales bacterium]